MSLGYEEQFPMSPYAAWLVADTAEKIADALHELRVQCAIGMAD